MYQNREGYGGDGEMLNTPRATRGMVSAPHHLAAQAGLAVLRDGGNAIEAAVAAAAVASVVYPHMSGLGGDGFWLIAEPGRMAVCIDASGAAGIQARPELYRDQGLNAVPRHGALAANTVAGAVSGWQAALDISARWGGRLPLSRLFEDAIHYARGGWSVTEGQAAASRRQLADLAGAPNFAAHFLAGSDAPSAGSRMALPALAATLERLAAAGLDDFYRGAIGQAMAAELQRLGSVLTSDDLARHRSVRRRPLSLALDCGVAYNLPPPTQGLASLMVLGLFQRLKVGRADGFEHLHGLVEATKRAFIVRDAHVTDPAYMAVHATTYLSDGVLDRLAARIDPRRALAWPEGTDDGDTVWLGVVDGQGRAVSYIQSLAQAFGSGVMLADTGILWHNRGHAFTLDESGLHLLKPRRKPFHTLNPALVQLKDGRLMVYGCMGGHGQPQTQAAVFTRYALYGQDLQAAVTAPRWALGRDWAAPSSDLKIEEGFPDEVVAALRKAGHEVRMVPRFDSLMGHAGAVVRRPDGLLEGAADPRGDGVVAAF